VPQMLANRITRKPCQCEPTMLWARTLTARSANPAARRPCLSPRLMRRHPLLATLDLPPALPSCAPQWYTCPPTAARWGLERTTLCLCLHLSTPAWHCQALHVDTHLTCACSPHAIALLRRVRPDIKASACR
jgi:hypothetical protein